MKKELKETQKNESWLVSNIESLYQTEIKNVLLATIDNNDKLNVFLYK